MEGLKVIEMGVWVAAPSCAGTLADWGADVIKIEPPNGDPLRGFFASMLGKSTALNPPFELDNRGKRSICLDLEQEDARQVALRLIGDADVFVTNNRPRVLDRFGLDYETLHEKYPRLVYAQVTGYGPESDSRDTPAYDVGAFWAHAGVGGALTVPGEDIPIQRGGMGDHVTGQMTLAAVCAALFNRERTGSGQRVSVPLVRAGVYTIGWEVMLALRLGVKAEQRDRRHSINPLINPYTASDGRSFWLLLLQPDRHWPNLCRVLQREDLLSDERFQDIKSRKDNAPELVEVLDEIFGSAPMDAWAKTLSQGGVWWAPVNMLHEVEHDPVVQDSGAFVDVPGPDGPIKMVSTPADFDETPWRVKGPPPELGQHTEEVLLELGFDWDRIIELKERGGIP